MATMVVCPGCGTANSASAGICLDCFCDLDPSPATVHAPSAKPEYVRWEDPHDEPAFTPAAGASGVHLDLVLANSGPGDVRWRWKHLWAFGFCAWGIPLAFSPLVESAGSFSDVLDAMLVIQIVGYVLGVAMAFHLVNRYQDGDWRTVGIDDTLDLGKELLTGAALGLGLLAAWVPIGLVFSDGRFSVDALVKALVGRTSGIGLLFAVLVVALGAPVIEEIYYRGMLFEKLNRKWPVLAVVVTSTLFVAAHGSLLIPSLWMMGVALAIARRMGRSLLFTMGAHGAWNAAVLLMAAFVVFSPSTTFSPSDAAYSVRHPADWDRHTQFEMSFPGGAVDLALEAPDGSVIGIWRVTMPPGAGGAQVQEVLSGIQAANAYGMTTTAAPAPSGVALHPVEQSYEAEGSATMEGISVKSRSIGVFEPTSGHAFVLELACPVPACPRAEQEFAAFLSSFAFSR